MKRVLEVSILENNSLHVVVHAEAMTPASWGISLADVARNIVEDVFEKGIHPEDATKQQCMQQIISYLVSEVINPTSDLDRGPMLKVVSPNERKDDDDDEQG